MIFDYDGHDDFWDAIKFARKNGFQVAFSSMCIEYWFVLHFEIMMEILYLLKREAIPKHKLK